MELPYSTELFPVYAVLTTSINNEKRILVITFLPLLTLHQYSHYGSNGLPSDLTTLYKRQINFVPIALAMAASRNNKI